VLDFSALSVEQLEESDTINCCDGLILIPFYRAPNLFALCFFCYQIIPECVLGKMHP
jgi:hypothetical protein